MMVAASPTEAMAPEASQVSEQNETKDDNGRPEEAAVEEGQETPAPAPAPRKTWSLPKAPPPSSIGSSAESNNNNNKKSLLEIMEEEKQLEQETERAQRKALEERLEAEEAAALAQALEASVAPTSVNGGGGDDDDIDEDMKLALMLSMQDQQLDPKMAPSTASSTAAAGSVASMPPMAASIPPAAASIPPVAAAMPDSNDNADMLTEEEMKEIEKALQEADAAEQAKRDAASLQLALELQGEEDGKQKALPKRGPQQGNVRTMNRADFLRVQGKGGDDHDDDGHYHHDDDGDYDFDDMDDNGTKEAGFRINSTKPSPWSRTDRTTIRGPNQELRTKHDEKLQGQANAYRLELRANDETGTRAHVGNKAFNSFHRSIQKKKIKGVAAHGHGRATADTDKTRDGALDGRVRLQIARAVNNGLIEAFHGCVKEGKEALVFHADQGSNSEGFDVAVKVFKRISEFRNRGQYVGGDPRYGNGDDFRHAGSRQQVEQWAEKEHRNLIRAYRAEVPVPKPLWQKENVLFLRFLGEDGWPSPQLRELSIKKASKKWTALYDQTMEAIQRLYCDAKLVHADLSEYNILVCPGSFLKRLDEEGGNDSTVANEEPDDDDEKEAKAPVAPDDGSEKKMAAEGDGDAKPSTKPSPVADDDSKMPVPSDLDTKPSAKSAPVSSEGNTKKESNAIVDDSLRIVLIDFGQAVDIRHPDAEDLLRRDVLRVKQFYDKMGITTIPVEAAMAYVQTKDAPLR